MCIIILKLLASLSVSYSSDLNFNIIVYTESILTEYLVFPLYYNILTGYKIILLFFSNPKSICFTH